MPDSKPSRPHPIAEQMLIEKHCPGWTVVQDSTRLWFRARHPSYSRTGIVVEGPNSATVIARVKLYAGPETTSKTPYACPVCGVGYPVQSGAEACQNRHEAFAEGVSAGGDRSEAVSRGYTGESCSDCGSMRMVRAGTCSRCQDCGSTSGGCS